MRAYLLAALLAAAGGAAAAEEPLCTSQELAVLDRWRQWLVDERATIDGSYAEVAKLRDKVGWAAWAKDTAALSNKILDVVEAVMLVKKLPLIARAALDLKRVKGLPKVRRGGADVDEEAFRASGEAELLFDVAVEILDHATDLAEELLTGRYERIRDQAVAGTNAIIAQRERRVRLYTTMRDQYVQTKALCDQDAEERRQAAGTGTPTPARAPEPSALHRELMLAARDIAPLNAAAPRADPTPSTPVDLGAIDRAVHGNRNTAPAPGPASDGVDLGALDRMAGTAPATIAPATAPQGRRPPSQEYYLEACLGKESSPACHRAHCLHVGAALNDKKWTDDCLRKK